MEAESNGALVQQRDTSQDVQVPVQEMVGIEVVPIGPEIDRCEGGIVRLVKGSGDGEVSLAAGLSGPQCREIARQLMTIADAASSGVERTIMCVSAVAMWKLPGQVLMVRVLDNRPHFDFMVKPKPRDGLMTPNKKLIVP